MIYNWLNNNLFSLFSKQCLLCLSTTSYKHLLCSSCKEDLPRNTFHCVICSIPIEVIDSNHLPLVCGKCQNNPPFYTTSLIPHIYASPLKQLISRFKFQSNLTYAPLLAYSFTNAISHRKHNLPECIVPVPLHPKRLRERGFNQALELARIISKQLDIPLDYSFCHRDKATPFQSGLSAKRRIQNLRNAFRVSKTHSYKHVAIFDDVVTTGTTVNELAKQLKNTGVETIEVWAIARTKDKKA